jgi:deferrochelatase/peroxidase EfeB
MNVFLDDVRRCPHGWVLVKSAEEVLDLLRAGDVENLSLDHDLGMRKVSKPGEPERFIEVEANDGSWLVLQMIEQNLWPQNKPQVHSANPYGALRMRGLIDRYGPYSESG